MCIVVKMNSYFAYQKESKVNRNQFTEEHKSDIKRVHVSKSNRHSLKRQRFNPRTTSAILNMSYRCH
jgi:hypothetical protein